MQPSFLKRRVPPCVSSRRPRYRGGLEGMRKVGQLLNSPSLCGNRRVWASGKGQTPLKLPPENNCRLGTQREKFKLWHNFFFFFFFPECSHAWKQIYPIRRKCKDDFPSSSAVCSQPELDKGTGKVSLAAGSRQADPHLPHSHPHPPPRWCRNTVTAR